MNSKFLTLLNPNNKTKDYLLGLVLVLLCFVLVGQIPLLMVAFYHNVSGLDELMELVDLNLLFVIILFPFISGFGALLLTNKFIQKLSIKSLFTSRDKFDWKRFWFSFSVWGILLVLFFILSFWLDGNIYFKPNWGAFLVLFLISFSILPIQTTFEELFFRSYLFKIFGVVLKRGWGTVLITGTLFGLMHGANPEVDKIGQVLLVFYIANGVFLGLLVLMDEGLELSMGYHAVNNIFAALIVTNDWQAFHTDALFIDQNPPDFGMESMLTLLVVQPLLLILFSKKYKWKNWKEKLFSKIEYPVNE